QPYPQAKTVLAVALGAWRGQGSGYHVSPPETEIACPVIEPALREHSHRTAPATSCGWMKRPCGLVETSAARVSSAERPVLSTMRETDCSSMSVSTKPGQTALTVIPVLAFSAASARIRPT